MNVLDRFREKKFEFQNKIIERQQRATINRAKNLKSLKEERIMLQGMKNIRDIEAKEKAEIKKLKNDTHLRKTLIGFGANIKANFKDNMKRVKMNNNSIYGSSENNVFTSSSCNEVFNFNNKKKR